MAWFVWLFIYAKPMMNQVLLFWDSQELRQWLVFPISNLSFDFLLWYQIHSSSEKGRGLGVGGSNYRLYSCQSEHESKVHCCCEQNSDRWFIFSRVFNPRGFGTIMFIIRYLFYCFVFENDFKFNFVIGGKGGFVIYASSFIMSPVLCHIGLMFFCVFCIRPCSL